MNEIAASIYYNGQRLVAIYPGVKPVRLSIENGKFVMSELTDAPDVVQGLTFHKGNT